MANMSYCRFENTLGDLRDCFTALREGDDDTQMSEYERGARNGLLALCAKIAEEFDADDYPSEI